MIGRKFVAGRKGMVGLVAFACAMAMGLSGCSLTTPTRAEVEPEPVKATLGADDLIEDGVLTVAMDMTDAPQAMTDQEGKPSGYYADIARLLAERMGLDLRVVSSADVTGSLSKGKADLYIGARTGEDGVVESGVLVQNASSIFAKSADGSREVPTVSATALQGAVVAVQSDSAAQDAMDSAGIDTTLKTKSNVNECFEALADGAIAASGTDLADQAMGILEDALSDGTLEALFRLWYGDLPFSLDDLALDGVTFEQEAPESEETPASEGESGELAQSDSLNSLG